MLLDGLGGGGTAGRLIQQHRALRPGIAMTARGRVAHVAGAEISQKPLSLSACESGWYTSAGLYLLGNGESATRR